MHASIKEVAYPNFTWIDISQPNKDKLKSIGEAYNLNFFQIKDSLQIGHLPKFERQAHYNFVILRAYSAKDNSRITNINELSNKVAFFYNDERLITIHRSAFGFLENLPTSFQHPQEMLVYIIRQMTQTFFEPAEAMSEKIDAAEKIIFLNHQTALSLEDLYFQKAQARISRKLLQITQNVIHQLEVNDEHITALQDVKDQLLNLILNYEEVTEDANNLLNTYMSVSTQKTNEVMKLLTVFSAFFLPLTFIAGVYGMNFNNMPELGWEYGYFMTLVAMLILSVVIYVWFKRKRFL